MDAKAEAKAMADAIRHAKEFCKRHHIPLAEWTLAESMAEDIGRQAFQNFWKVYDK